MYKIIKLKRISYWKYRRFNWGLKKMLLVKIWGFYVWDICKKWKIIIIRIDWGFYGILLKFKGWIGYKNYLLYW